MEARFRIVESISAHQQEIQFIWRVGSDEGVGKGRRRGRSSDGLSVSYYKNCQDDKNTVNYLNAVIQSSFSFVNQTD